LKLNEIVFHWNTIITFFLFYITGKINDTFTDVNKKTNKIYMISRKIVGYGNLWLTHMKLDGMKLAQLYLQNNIGMLLIFQWNIISLNKTSNYLLSGYWSFKMSIW